MQQLYAESMMNVEFYPSQEQLAFSILTEGECDIQGIWPEPLKVVIDVLEKYKTYPEVVANLPNIEPYLLVCCLQIIIAYSRQRQGSKLHIILSRTNQLRRDDGISSSSMGNRSNGQGMFARNSGPSRPGTGGTVRIQ